MAWDRHFGGAGPDLLYGDGSGGMYGDSPDGSNPDDLLYGGGGDDTLIGDFGSYGSVPYNGNDVLDGGDGNDVLEGRAGDDTLLGDAGNDRLDSSYGRDLLDGGAGDDTLAGGADDNALSGGAGNDTLFGDWGADTLVGGAGDDTLSGSADDDTLAGGAGDDTLAGGLGADVLVGGAGNNTVLYESGYEPYYYGSYYGVTVDLATGAGRHGEAEGDRLVSIQNIVGTGSEDALTGDDGDNLIDGQIAWQEVYEAPPIEIYTSDTLAGAGGDDTLIGNGALDGGAGDDVLNGGGSPDNLLAGGPGNDTLIGSGTLDGGAGDDILDGGSGPDTLTGGAGADEFVVPTFWWSEVITVTDFDTAEGDRISVSYPTGGERLLTWQSGGDVRVLVETSGPFGMYQVAVLKDTTVAALGADWWHMG